MNNNKFSFGKLFWGAFFILAGIAILLNNINVWPFHYHIPVFRLALTLLLIGGLLHGISHRNFFLITFSAAFLFIIYNRTFLFFHISAWSLLCVALFLAIGLCILFPNHKFTGGGSNPQFYQDRGKKVFTENGKIPLLFQNSFGSTTKYVNTDAFVNAVFENNFGEMKVYFDNTVIQSGIAEINVTNAFGHVALFIPKTWKVENHMNVYCGAVTEKNQNESTGTPVLKIYGETTFGAVSITYI